jgi:ABC-type branched-subunit amino acid transport system substrate-binding protein
MERGLRGATLSAAPRWAAGLFGAAVAGLLVACAQMGTGPSFGPVSPTAPQPASGEVIGGSGVRVALLLPKSAAGNAGTVAQAFRNAAELAMRDFPSAGIQVTAYDTGGTPEGAQLAINRALADNSEIALGPLFSNAVQAVTPAARRAGVPVVAFSSDISVAGSGTYLLSFLPRSDIERIVSFAGQRGRRSFAALLPDNAYGSVVEASFRETAARAGGRVVSVQRYEANEADIRAKAAALVQTASQIDALLVPDAGEPPILMAQALAEAGVSGERLQLLGSGQWDNPAILNNPALSGAWFPAPTREAFDAFAQRYQAAYGSPPPRNAALAYDATVLAAGLVRQFGANRFTQGVMTNPSGFTGIDGVFRFLPSGINERRLAVYEVTGTGARIVDPAPRSFTGS